MFKKFRQIYWSQRDRGMGGRFILLVMVMIVSFGSIAGLGVRNVVIHNTQNSNSKKVTSGSAVSGEAVSKEVSGSSISSDEDSFEDDYEDSPEEIGQEQEFETIDTSGMTTFLGYMSDAAYANLVDQTKNKCKELGVKAAKKLDYQKMGATDFDVIGYIQLGEDKVYECSYNLKSDVVALNDTTYLPTDIEQMAIAEKKAEAEKLAKEQEEIKKKAEKEAAKKEKTKKKSKNTKKKKKKKSSKK